MATIVRVKRSTTAGDPALLGVGELAHSSLAGLQNNGGDRVYIGVGTETAGNAANHHVIGGKYFTDMLDHVHGTVTADSALIVDSSSKLDILNVDNVTLNGNTVSTTDTNGNLILNPNGTGKVSIASAYTIPRVDGTINQYLQTDGSGTASWVTIAASSASLSIAGDTGSDVVTVGVDTLTFVGGTGITSVVTNNTATFDIDSTVATLTGSQTLTNKTLTAPIVSSITGTGALTISAGSTNTNITLVPDGTGTVDVSSKKITSLADPTAAQDAATKSYVDSLSQGLKIHPPCDVATTDTLTSLTSGGTVTYANGTLGVGATLTLQNALATLDTITLTNGMRVLVKNQATQAHNGIYTWATGGTVLTRATDSDQLAELSGGDFSFVINGSQFGDCGFVQTEVVATMGTTAIIYTQFSGAGAYTAGAGITQTGTTFDVVGTTNRITVAADSVDISTSYVGQSSITTLGTIGTGTWQGTVVGGTYGGTGVNNGASTITIGGNLTHSGAFTQEFAATANTSVTLPTTGTLATLAGSEALSNKTITASSFSGTTIAGSGLITLTNATDATALGTAAVVLTGGISVAKAMFIGTNITGAGPGTFAVPISVIDGFQMDGGTY